MGLGWSERMNRIGLKLFLMIVLFLAIVFQFTYIAKDKREEKIFQRANKDRESIELVKIKYPTLGDYIKKLIGYGYFTIGSIHIMDDYYEVKGKVVGDTNTIKDFFSYFEDVKDYRIKDYLVHSLEEQYQLDIVLELPR